MVKSLWHFLTFNTALNLVNIFIEKLLKYEELKPDFEENIYFQENRVS